MVENNSFIAILGWMYNIGLEDMDEILVYAIVYGFTQDGRTEFEGSYKYIEERIRRKRTKTIEVVASLVNKGYLIKRQIDVNGVPVNKFSAVIPQDIKDSSQSADYPSVLRTGGTQREPNNNSKETNISTTSSIYIGKENEFLSCEKEEQSQPKTPTLEEKRAAMKAREQAFRETLYAFCTERGGQYEATMVKEFFDYWSEPNKSGTKMLFEMKPTFDIARRLATWARKNQQNGRANTSIGLPSANGNSQAQRGYGGIPVGLSKTEAKLLAIQQARRDRGF